MLELHSQVTRVSIEGFNSYGMGAGAVILSIDPLIIIITVYILSPPSTNTLYVIDRLYILLIHVEILHLCMGYQEIY
jgi:hypothetical protein